MSLCPLSHKTSGFPSIEFTERKFRSLGSILQHKQCANLLRQMYDALVEDAPAGMYAEAYQQMREWMNLQEVGRIDNREEVADLYHEHLKLASCNLREHNLLPRVTHNDRTTAEKAWPVAVYLDNLRSAHNVGSIIRTIEGLSLGSLYFSHKTPYIDHPQVQKAAMGSAQWINCNQTEDLDRLPRPIIALETSPDATPLYEFLFPEAFTVVVGNEEYGCREQTLRQTDFFVNIPMRGRKNSFNVANAFSMAAYEIARQRSRQKDTI